MYKLIALDMDGTLLNEDKEISKRTMLAIGLAKEKGKKVVLATGRPLNGVRRYLEKLEMFDEHDYVIAFNGALVQKTKSEEIVFNMPLSYAAYKELYELSQVLGVHIHALTESTVTTPCCNPYTDIEASINQIQIEEMAVEDLDPERTIVKVMFIDAPEKLDKAISLLPDDIKAKYTILRSAPYFLEFLHPEVNKGVGVHAVAQALGFTKEQVICVGDAGNDLAMIQFAGLGVAMGNAFDEIKEEADYVTFSNDDHGVAHVIEKFML